MAFFQACQSPEEINYARYYTNGKKLYDQYCQNCHNTDGLGLGTLIPPLTDTTFIKKNREVIACIIKYGLSDSIKVNGKNYKEVMPANPELPDLDIAALVTYITNTFGNKQGLYDVSNAGSDLKRCPH